MLTIDGLLGYGQVLRTALALSALTLKPIKVTNIRKQRTKPGLMAQHLAGVKTIGEFCNAEIKGAKIGSTEIEFAPKEHQIENKHIDIGTAGSIPLLLQTLTPLLVFSQKPVSLEIIGGTAGLGSPTIEYVKYVTFGILYKIGIEPPVIEVKKQGFYPKGQGVVQVKFSPAKKNNSVKLTSGGNIENIHGISIAGSLPNDVVERQKLGAMKLLTDHGFDPHIQASVEKTASPGTSITLVCHSSNTILGADNIGKLGVRAEDVGEKCAESLVASIRSNAALDRWMSDQILIFLALADGRSEIKVEEVTEHCQTNIRVIEQVLGVEFEVDKNMISVEGIGYKI